MNLEWAALNDSNGKTVGHQRENSKNSVIIAHVFLKWQ